jgi:hypothetical protein
VNVIAFITVESKEEIVSFPAELRHEEAGTLSLVPLQRRAHPASRINSVVILVQREISFASRINSRFSGFLLIAILLISTEMVRSIQGIFQFPFGRWYTRSGV